MSGSVAELIDAISKHTGFKRTFVEQRARYLQADGRLRVVAGRNQPRATARDMTNLLFALASSKARGTAELAHDFESLVQTSDCAATERHAGDFVERLITRVWVGNRDDRRKAITLTYHPAPKIDVKDGPTFYPASELVKLHGDIFRLDNTSDFETHNALTVSCMAIARIGCDIGLPGCADAA